MRRNSRSAYGALGVAAALAALAAVAVIVYGVVQEESASAAANPQADPDGVASAGNPIDWGYWLAANPDIVGWLRIPGTAVDQPLIKAPEEDPTFYLSHDAYKNPSAYGTCYVDAGCEEGIDSFNVVVFGHNISVPPEVLHDVEGYSDAQFAKDHSRIEVFTPDESRVYTVVAADVVKGTDPVKRTEFDGAADYWAYRNERVGASRVQLDPERGFSKMMTICTCSYHENPQDERTLVYAQLEGS